jgi:membrane associated rhomboid family serine protease
VVFFAWQAPSARLRAFMEAWFVSSAGPQRAALAPSNVARALLSSMSHRSLLHLACNMAGVVSFSPLVIDGAESIARPKLAPAEYGALWAASGTASALASSAFSARFGSGAGGLGASGFLFSLLTFHALASPDSRVLLFFVFECSMRDGLGLATVANCLLAAKEVLASRGIGKPPVVDGVSHLVCVAPRNRACAPSPLAPIGHAHGPFSPSPLLTHAHTPFCSGTVLGVAAFSWARERARRRRRERKVARAAPSVSIQKPPGNSARV